LDIDTRFSAGLEKFRAKEAAEKVGRRMEMRPSAAKAAPVFNRLCTG
jgi:hypothetical protein